MATLLNQLTWAAYQERGLLLLVSAGVDITRPLSMQGNTFWWGGRMFRNIDAPYSIFKRIVRGFDFFGGGAEVNSYTATLDDRCGFGGGLIVAYFDADGGYDQRHWLIKYSYLSRN